MKIFLKKLGQKGFSHHLIAPIAVIGLVAAVGTYILITGHAQAPPSNSVAQASSGSSTRCIIVGTGHLVIMGSNGRRQDFYEPYHQTLSQHQNSSGDCVRSAQGLLDKVCKNSIAQDGQYGQLTAAEASRLQAYARVRNATVNDKPVSVDGSVGPQTWVLLHYLSPLMIPGVPKLPC